MKISILKMPLALTTLALAASAATAGGGCCDVSKTGDANGKQAEAPKAEIVCPVMGSKIASVDKAAGKSVYKGVTYYFCCAGCKPKFDKDPAKYVKQTAAKPGDSKAAPSHNHGAR